ncbi:MAG: hypothetical protein J6C46_02945 [Clostridia bacterium]|nr:hypothetical protein [Clostridia bacterium]
MNDKNKSILPYEQNIFSKIKNFIKKLFSRKKENSNKTDVIEKPHEISAMTDNLQNKIENFQRVTKLKSLLEKDKNSVYSMTDDELDELIRYYSEYIPILKRKIHSNELEIKKLEKIS